MPGLGNSERLGDRYPDIIEKRAPGSHAGGVLEVQTQIKRSGTFLIQSSNWSECHQLR